MKKINTFLLLLAIILTLVACGSNSSSPEPDSTPVDSDFTLEDAADIYGNPMDDSIINNATLVLVNYWEPWCGPCVGEMPDLQLLYENYKDKGLLIIGVYSTFEMQEDAEAIAREYGITYPLVKCNDTLALLQQDYVPATYFVDKNGNFILSEPHIGSQSYDAWEEMINEYLN